MLPDAEGAHAAPSASGIGKQKALIIKLSVDKSRIY